MAGGNSKGGKVLDFGFYNMDCMEGMKQFPDKYFDLAIVDPPYGINVTGTPGGVKQASAVQNRSAKIGGSRCQSQNIQGIR